MTSEASAAGSVKSAPITDEGIALVSEAIIEDALGSTSASRLEMPAAQS